MNPTLVPAAFVTLAVAVVAGGCASNAPTAIDRPAAAGQGEVVRVTDGDTIVVRHGGSDDRVRLLGIDTPEVQGPFTHKECFGPQASARMRALAGPGTTVRLETDPTQDLRDRNGRLLAYVFRGREEMSLNERMVAEGYARRYVVRRPFLLAARFGEREKDARSAGRGMWGACGGPPEPRPVPTSRTDRDCPPAQPIKGNLPSRIYHRPGDPSYEDTRPERCFATERDAAAAGFRPPRG